MGAELGAAAVAAAGNAAGGAAASALMGDTSYPKGGGIDGLTSADTGKSGISPAVQIDPTTALEYFQTAANQYSKQATEGLNYYNSSVTNAINTLGQTVQAANKQIDNVAYMGKTSQNQYLRMLGLDAQSPTSEISSQVANLGGTFGDIAAQIAKAENFTDPAQRASARGQILSAMTGAKNQQIASLQQQQQQELAKLGPAPNAAAMLQQDPGLANLYNTYYSKTQSVEEFLKNMGNTTGAKNIATNIQNYNDQIAAINNKYQGQINSISSTVDGINQSYKTNYGDENTYAGYSGAEIAKRIADANPWLSEYKNQTNALIGNENQLIGKINQQADALVNKFQGQLIPDLVKPTAETLANTPGYQFSLQQGQEAVLAAAARGGMLSSGNTLAAMDKYSQGLAQQVYQQEYTNYLNSIATNNSLLGNVGITQNNANSLISGIYGNQAQQQSALASANSTASNNYMTNLYNAMTQGNNAIAQQSANTMSGGTNVANLQQGQGAAALQTYQGIGQALYNASTNQGNTWNQDMLANMQAQNAMISQSNTLSTQAGIAAGQQSTSNGYLQLQQLNTLNNLANQTGQARGFGNAILG